MSTQELLQKLTVKSKTAHLLKPKTLEDRVKIVRDKSLDVMKKAPGFTARISIAFAGYMWEFIKRPAIASEWATKISIRTKKEVQHFWDGFKLLGADIAYASRLVRKMTSGHALSRRERVQLEKTTADVFRLVPFAVFIIVPFMEFALPIFLKVFPNMLPSQFESKLKKEEQLKKKIKAQLELAKFLQDTVDAIAHELRRSESQDTVATAQSLERFIERCRKGQSVTNEEIMRFSKLFSDEITLDNISRAQLVAMCKYMNLSPFGTDAYLRTKLRNKLRKLKADDRFIYWEGVDSLSLEELMFACQERGMKIGLPKKELQQQLKQWIELSLDKNIPASLLILSRAFTYTDRVQSEDAITMALGTMPDDVVQEVTLDSTVSSEDDLSINRRKLDSLKRQEKLIQQEEEENRKRRLIEEDLRKKKQLEEELRQLSPSVRPALAAGAGSVFSPSDALVLREDEELMPKQNKEEEDLKELITVMAYASSMTNERAEFDELLDKYNESVGMTKEIHKDNMSMNRLNNYIANLLRRLDEQIDEVDLSIGTEMNVLDKDRDGYISIAEVEQSLELLKEKPSEETLREILSQLDKDGDGRISIKELVNELAAQRAKERKLEKQL